jgi:hypothetical protein
LIFSLYFILYCVGLAVGSSCSLAASYLPPASTPEELQEEQKRRQQKRRQQKRHQQEQRQQEDQFKITDSVAMKANRLDDKKKDINQRRENMQHAHRMQSKKSPSSPSPAASHNDDDVQVEEECGDVKTDSWEYWEAS